MKKTGIPYDGHYIVRLVLIGVVHECFRVLYNVNNLHSLVQFGGSAVCRECTAHLASRLKIKAK